MAYEEYHVDVKDLIKAVREVAAENPDHVYKSQNGGGCNYTEADGSLGCIVGHAMAKLGKQLPPPGDYDMDMVTSSYVSSDAWSDLLDVGSASYESRWIRRVQSYQDTGSPWSEAVRLADTEIFDQV